MENTPDPKSNKTPKQYPISERESKIDGFLKLPTDREKKKRVLATLLWDKERIAGGWCPRADGELVGCVIASLYNLVGGMPDACHRTLK